MLKQIGKYTISERIGRGTYSRVYRAVDSQGRAVAIKVSTTRTEPEQLDEFQRDLVAAASVLHSSLVAVHDLGFEDDFPYLVMELVEGRDLDKILKSAKGAAASLAERIRVMQRIGDALKTAHERGVFHLDIRPSKIMMGDDGGAKLLDLGLGRLSFDAARVTDCGYLVGAPFYMSPERLGAIDTANGRCDIWSFGVTFYEWISGRHPFYDDDGDRMIGNIMDAAPAAVAGVPAPLNQVILRAIEKEPAKRYQNFAELLADLKPIVSDLQREESDALMAQALKQSDSGRWHEARRIARQLRDLEPQRGPSSQILGFSEHEQEQEKERVVERARPIAPPSVPSPVQPLATVASAAAAVDIPDSAPSLRPVQHQPSPRPAAAAQVKFASSPKPQRPERTAPKIPAIGAKNGAAVRQNGSPADARVKPVPNAANGSPSRMAAAAPPMAAPAWPAVATERDAAPKAQPARTPRPGNLRTASRQPDVRILEIEEHSDFPWVKILSFAVPALLMIGALFFFLRPDSQTLNPPGKSSEDAKQVSASRVRGDRPETPLSAGSGPATGTNAKPIAANPATDSTRRVFDPKSLAPVKAAAIPMPRRRGNAALAGLAPPMLGSSAAATDAGTLPAALSAAPPPPDPVVPPLTPTKLAPASATPQTVEAAQNSAGRVGGVFVQPVLVHTVQPIYPPSAVQRKAQGVVRFQATIAKDGSVQNLQLVSGDPMLNLAAKQAVLQWKYRPAMLNGEPMEVMQAIVVKFNLN